jgi:PAS domain S-box-containing protein
LSFEVFLAKQKNKKNIKPAASPSRNSGSKLIKDPDAKDIKKLLEQSERKYMELAGNAPIAVARLDAAADKYVFVNDEFTRQSGYTLEEFNSLGKKEIFEMVYPDDRDTLYAAFKEWVYGGYKGTLHHEYRITNRHKKLLWLDAYFYSEFDSKGKLVTVNQLYIDITERKLTEEKLRILGHAFESTTEMISITNLNNRFTYVNRAFEEKYGYTENELIGKEVEIVGSVQNPPEIHEIVFKDTQKGGWEGELINTRKDGSEFPILLSTSSIKNANGETIGYIGVARDITELKNAYDRLRHSLKEKEILLKEVYHRVKNNMQVISSLLNIQSQSVTEPTAIELFRETQNRVRIMQLIHEKLYKSQDLSKIDFSLYIRDLTYQLKRAYPISKNIELVINSEGVYLGVDRAIPCGLIINELVSNSFKYAFKDGRKGSIYIELTQHENEYTMIVSDNGAGLPITIDFRESDTLGMILISTLSDQLDAKVEIDRAEGTKFTFRF